MLPRNWTKAFDTGHPVIDGQHRKLFGFLDELEDLMIAGDDGDKTVATCADFRAFLEKHSDEEEEVLRQVEFPGLRQHMDEHIQTQWQMNKIFKNCGEACRKGAMGPCLGDLTHQLLDHIIRIDLGFRSYLQMKGLATSNR